MSFGSMNRRAEIRHKSTVRDEEGFPVDRDELIAKVRCYREGRHGSYRWANLAAFSDATDRFVWRQIPGIKFDISQYIVCEGDKFVITSVENIRGRGMYVEALARKVEAIDGKV